MSESTWTISVKTVSSYSSELHAESNFNITVDPNESISSIYQKIELQTGLKADQQRLIYRGRLITAQSQLDSIQPNDHISDINGLGDGHTIHLVPRPSHVSTETNASTDSTAASTANSAPEMSFLPGGGTSGFFATSGPGFLAALLGMNPSSEGIHVETINSDGTSFRRSNSGNNSSSRRRNRNSHIRTVDDPLHPEPCQMEVIRQSLLTMHTIMNSQDDLRSKNASHPLLSTRRWYKGQWLDVKDTVNQWLEATIVDIMTPDEIIILDANRRSTLAQSSKSHVIKYEDEAVGSHDYDGRLKLLLEPSQNPNDRRLADLNDDEDLVGFRERAGNEHVQLLLVHFNSWPHRWDEWIRSDSDRIRPFRTRSRHIKKANQFCPEPESEFRNENVTNIRSVEDDDIESVALLPEVLRTMTNVQTLYEEAIHENLFSQKKEAVNKLNQIQLYDLSIAMKCERLNSENGGLEYERGVIHDIVTAAGMTFENPKNVDLESLDDESQMVLYKLLISSNVKNEKDKDTYPWIGTERVTDLDELDDHAKQNHKDQADRYRKTLDKKKLQDLAPLLDRLGRILIDAAPHVASIAASLPERENDQKVDKDEKMSSRVAITDNEESADVHLSDMNDDEALVSTSNVPMTDDNEREDESISPDHVDFVNGFINHRENGSSFRRRAHSSDRGSSLLSAYLSNIIGNGSNAPQGGRPGNVDVHIHAIVTGPGGVPINPMSGLFPNRNGTTDFNTARQSTPQPTVHPSAEANEDLFSDLYATTVEPSDDVEIEDDHPVADDEDESDDDASVYSLDMPDLDVRGSSSSSSESEVGGGEFSDDSDEDMPSVCERRGEDSSDDGSENVCTSNNLDRVREDLVVQDEIQSLDDTNPISNYVDQSAENICDDSMTQLYFDTSEPITEDIPIVENEHSDVIEEELQSSGSSQEEVPSVAQVDNEDDSSSPTRGWFHRMLRRM